MIQLASKLLGNLFGRAPEVEYQPKGLLGLRPVDPSWYMQEDQLPFGERLEQHNGALEGIMDHLQRGLKEEGFTLEQVNPNVPPVNSSHKIHDLVNYGGRYVGSFRVQETHQLYYEEVVIDTSSMDRLFSIATDEHLSRIRKVAKSIPEELVAGYSNPNPWDAPDSGFGYLTIKPNPKV